MTPEAARQKVREMTDEELQAQLDSLVWGNPTTLQMAASNEIVARKLAQAAEAKPTTSRGLSGSDLATLRRLQATVGKDNPELVLEYGRLGRKPRLRFRRQAPRVYHATPTQGIIIMGLFAATFLGVVWMTREKKTTEFQPSVYSETT